MLGVGCWVLGEGGESEGATSPRPSPLLFALGGCCVRIDRRKTQTQTHLEGQSGSGRNGAGRRQVCSRNIFGEGQARRHYHADILDDCLPLLVPRLLPWLVRCVAVDCSPALSVCLSVMCCSAVLPQGECLRCWRLQPISARH